MADRQKNKQAQSEKNGIPPLEWVVAIVGLVLVLSTIAYLLYQAVAGDESPPNIVLEVNQIIPRESGYLVQVNVRNSGGETAAQLLVEGTLRDGDESVETSETQIDYVPPKSERGAGLFFTLNPEDYEIVLRPVGYREP
jgi:uncharacterized protein (TIGR02588 family)